ncbi:MAG TPA: MOSC domain-containing protein [Caulobacteraceae bacterium]
MTAAIAALFNHPIKGFTPQKLTTARLAPGEGFPGDRLYAVEDGPCGFDPAAPGFIPKQKFAVLAKTAAVARARTDYDQRTGMLRASSPGAPDFEADLTHEDGRTAFAAWLSRLLGDAVQGPLRVIDGVGHRFLDHPLGHVSVINLASLRDFEARLGRPVDPLRFRANIYVDGWPAWVENGWAGRALRIGNARAKVFQPITRCAAPDVDPSTAARDIEVTRELHRLYGHLLCGIYVRITQGGTVNNGDEVDSDPGPLG